MSESRSGAPILLKVDSIDVHYGGIHAVKNLSLVARRGELTTLIGANGAGKTTTLKAICGLLTPTSGTVEFNGESIAGSTPDVNVRRGLVLCPEGRRIFPDLTVDENLDLGAYTRHDHTAIRDDLKKMHDMFP